MCTSCGDVPYGLLFLTLSSLCSLYPKPHVQIPFASFRILFEPLLQLLATATDQSVARRLDEKVLQPIIEAARAASEAPSADRFGLVANKKENALALLKQVFALAASRCASGLGCV